MPRLVRLSALAAAFALLAPLTPASANSVDAAAFATFGSNSAILRAESVTVCDGESDGNMVMAQVRWIEWTGMTERTNSGGAVTCKTFYWDAGLHPRAVRVCETRRRTGIVACGKWAVRIPAY